MPIQHQATKSGSSKWAREEYPHISELIRCIKPGFAVCDGILLAWGTVDKLMMHVLNWIEQFEALICVGFKYETEFITGG